MEKVVRVATTGFQNLFATEARVRLMALNGATGLHAYGQGFHRDDDAKYIDVYLGDLRGGDVRTIFVDLTLPMSQETTEYLAFELEYITADSSEPAKQSGRMAVRIVATGSQPT